MAALAELDATVARFRIGEEQLYWYLMLPKNLKIPLLADKALTGALQMHLSNVEATVDGRAVEHCLADFAKSLDRLCSVKKQGSLQCSSVAIAHRQ